MADLGNLFNQLMNPNSGASVMLGRVFDQGAGPGALPGGILTEGRGRAVAGQIIRNTGLGRASEQTQAGINSVTRGADALERGDIYGVINAGRHVLNNAGTVGYELNKNPVGRQIVGAVTGNGTQPQTTAPTGTGGIQWNGARVQPHTTVPPQTHSPTVQAGTGSPSIVQRIFGGGRPAVVAARPDIARAEQVAGQGFETRSKVGVIIYNEDLNGGRPEPIGKMRVTHLQGQPADIRYPSEAHKQAGLAEVKVDGQTYHMRANDLSGRIQGGLGAIPVGETLKVGQPVPAAAPAPAPPPASTTPEVREAPPKVEAPPVPPRKPEAPATPEAETAPTPAPAPETRAGLGPDQFRAIQGGLKLAGFDAGKIDGDPGRTDNSMTHKAMTAYAEARGIDVKDAAGNYDYGAVLENLKNDQLVQARMEYAVGKGMDAPPEVGKAVQAMLQGNGHDVGRHGIDGDIGEDTIAAFKGYKAEFEEFGTKPLVSQGAPLPEVRDARVGEGPAISETARDHADRVAADGWNAVTGEGPVARSNGQPMGEIQGGKLVTPQPEADQPTPPAASGPEVLSV